MEEKVYLKTLRCPSCGASLKVENDQAATECLYCGNTVIPTEDLPSQSQKEAASGAIKVEGIKTAGSALAYMDLFFEEYDWEAFAYAQTLSVQEMDILAASLQSSYADDKNTWFACFKAAAVPFAHKVKGCESLLATAVEEHKKDNLDAYSTFDAYKRIAAMVLARKKDVLANLEKFLSKAAKYGAAEKELDRLKVELESVKALTDGAAVVYNHLEDVPEVKAFLQEKNREIEEKLAARGIDAKAEYARATQLIQEKNYTEALGVLLTLKGFADTKKLIEELDRYFLLNDVLEITGKLYYFKKEDDEDSVFALYPSVNGQVGEEPIIRRIRKIITNYADVLYYLDDRNYLQQYRFATGVGRKLFDRHLTKRDIYVHNRKAYLIAPIESSDEDRVCRNLVVLNLATGGVTEILKDINSVISLTGNKLIYTAYESGTNWLDTCVLNVDTMEIVPVGAGGITVEGFVGNCAIYTTCAPNDKNKNLYIKPLNEQPPILIEQNIYEFCDIIAGKLFYYIGNSARKTLITISRDGTDRREWPRYIHKVLFEQGGWLYFVRKSGYNSVLCRARLDGSRYKVIAADVEKFIKIQNGYLYYINDDAQLVKVRMDGSNFQVLCEAVESVLSVREDKVIFVSYDDRILINEEENVFAYNVKSIYAVDFSGSGKIKLAYNIQNADEHDDDTVYYVAAENPYNRLQALYKLDVLTNQTEKLLDLVVPQVKGKGIGFAIAMGVMVVCLCFALIFFLAEMPVPGFVGIVGAFISLMIGLGVRDGDGNGDDEEIYDEE